MEGATVVAIAAYAYDATGNRTALITAAVTPIYTRYSDANRMSAVKQPGAVVENYTCNNCRERVWRAPVSGDPQVTVYDDAAQWIGNYGATGQSLQEAIWLDIPGCVWMQIKKGKQDGH
ncbi:MAG TPA: hypothetical protein DCM50_05465 [Stenotrophomonas sp.]|nr:hypothetical protein [Stenotrophomonas sp.]